MRSPAAQGPAMALRLHVREQLLVDPLGGAAQRQLAQRGQVARREIVLQRPLGLLGHIDLAFLQPLDQIVGREVDQLDRVGAVEDRVGHGLAHAHMGDLGDDVVQALDMLDVDGGVDVDAGRQQLLDIEIALGVAAAGRIGMGELVDQRDLRAARDDGVEVHLLERSGRGSRCRLRGMTSSPRTSASVSARPWVSTKPTTTSMPALRLAGRFAASRRSCRRRARRRRRSSACRSRSPPQHTLLQTSRKKKKKKKKKKREKKRTHLRNQAFFGIAALSLVLVKIFIGQY